MSRVGKNPVALPDGVEFSINGEHVTVKGKLGQLTAFLCNRVRFRQDDRNVFVEPTSNSKEARMMWGTARRILQNLVTGVTEGFVRKLEIQGVGYRAATEGSDLILQLGFSHEVRFPIPQGISIKCEKPTLISVEGIDKQQVGQVAAKIRSYRPPEPYKGKGVRYEGEYVYRKEGKKK